MSALPPKVDIGTQPRNVCFVPKRTFGPSQNQIIGGPRNYRNFRGLPLSFPTTDLLSRDALVKWRTNSHHSLQTARGAAVFAAEIKPVEPVWILFGLSGH